MVRLKALMNNIQPQIVSSFNSKMVRLKVSFSFVSPRLLYCFNSKMVRLKDEELRATQLSVMFQFQNGAIKSKKRRCLMPLNCMFQFQNGAIKSKEFRQFLYDRLYVSIPKWCD